MLEYKTGDLFEKYVQSRKEAPTGAILGETHTNSKPQWLIIL